MNRIRVMKWLEIVRFELVFQLRRKSIWFFFGLFLIPLIGVTNERLLDANREVLFNAPLCARSRSSSNPLLVKTRGARLLPWPG